MPRSCQFKIPLDKADAFDAALRAANTNGSYLVDFKNGRKNRRYAITPKMEMGSWKAGCIFLVRAGLKGADLPSMDVACHDEENIYVE